MHEVNVLAVLAATIAAFVTSGVWYAVWGRAMTESPNQAAGAKMQAWQIGAELIRSAVVASVLSYLFSRLETSTWFAAAGYGVLLWLAFPAVLLAGSVIHENVRVKLAAIHAGDWFVKLMVVASIVGIGR